MSLDLPLVLKASTLEYIPSKELLEQCFVVNKEVSQASILALCSRSDSESIACQIALFNHRMPVLDVAGQDKEFLEQLGSSLSKLLLASASTLAHRLSAIIFIARLAGMSLEAVTFDDIFYQVQGLISCTEYLSTELSHLSKVILNLDRGIDASFIHQLLKVFEGHDYEHPVQLSSVSVLNELAKDNPSQIGAQIRAYCFAGPPTEKQWAFPIKQLNSYQIVCYDKETEELAQQKSPMLFNPPIDRRIDCFFVPEPRQELEEVQAEVAASLEALGFNNA